MKILLIHPEDNLEEGPWSSVGWDRIVDIGLGGMNCYARWRRQFHCPVTTLDSLRDGFDDFRRVRDVLGAGCGRLIDDYGLDWWEIMSILLTAELDTLILLQRLAATIESSDEVFVSRPGLHAGLLQRLLATRVKIFSLRRTARKSGLRHYLRVSNKLSATQLVDVFWDKLDAGYQFRARFSAKRKPSTRPVVLLPTPYINVSRTGIAYANAFPQEDFLLITTRRSGWVKDPPQNVSTAWLASYASVRDPSKEDFDFENRWLALREELAGGAEIGTLNALGYMDDFPQRFRHGFQVRDAWRNVLDTEPVQAVLCADDSNPYTRIPLLLAQTRNLLNIACHHGALDGAYFFKRIHGDVIWAKGRLEEDYLTRVCGVPGERVEIGAPALPAPCDVQPQSNRSEFRPFLLFISEAFDVAGGRPEEFYRELLPPMADLAQATGHKLIVKLHPFESKRERARIVDRVLSAEQKRVTRIVDGPLSEDLLAKTWCGVTILSTVAMECAIRGIPCFLCKWLDFGAYGYADQLIRFGVGIGLNDPDQISKIPEYLERHLVSASVQENCWQSVAPGRLRELLSLTPKPCAAAAR